MSNPTDDRTIALQAQADADSDVQALEALTSLYLLVYEEYQQVATLVRTARQRRDHASLGDAMTAERARKFPRAEGGSDLATDPTAIHAADRTADQTAGPTPVPAGDTDAVAEELRAAASSAVLLQTAQAREAALLRRRIALEIRYKRRCEQVLARTFGLRMGAPYRPPASPHAYLLDRVISHHVLPPGELMLGVAAFRLTTEGALERGVEVWLELGRTTEVVETRLQFTVPLAPSDEVRPPVEIEIAGPELGLAARIEPGMAASAPALRRVGGDSSQRK
jgi:hypothetical protein